MIAEGIASVLESIVAQGKTNARIHDLILKERGKKGSIEDVNRSRGEM